MDWNDVGALGELIAAIAAVLTLGVVAAAALFAWHEVREVRRARYAQILVDLLLQWNDSLLEARVAVDKVGSPEALRTIIEETSSNGDPRYYELVRVLIFLEDLALLERQGMVSRDFVLDRFLFTLDEEYRRWQPAIDFFRSERGPAAFEGFEALAVAARAEIARRQSTRE